MAGNRLSKRERECLELAGQGLSAKEIARQLGGLSDLTVETYLGRARRKLGVARSVAGARAIEAEFRTDKSDILPKSVVATEFSHDLDRAPAVVTVQERPLPFYDEPPFLRISTWLPWRSKDGDRHDMKPYVALAWVAGLPLFAALSLSIIALAVVAIGYVWIGGHVHADH